MSLTVMVAQKAPEVYVVYPAGSLNSNTYAVLESKIEAILAQRPRMLVLDLARLEYISSAGIRVILKTRGALKKMNGQLKVMNLQPQIKKVFDIINALPSKQIFASVAEFDAYLETMQKAVKSDRAL